MSSEIVPPMRVPAGTLKRVKKFYKGTTRNQTVVMRDALLVGLRVFEMDGYQSAPTTAAIPNPPKG